MVVERGQVWWADLGEPDGSEPGFRRPVLIVSSDAFNRSRIRTVIAVVLTANLRLVDAPGNVLVPAKAAGLPRDSVANVSQVVTLDKEFLTELAGRIKERVLSDIDSGLRLVLSL
ncbi:MAG: type II toxin-antitoxin system PemK/MazF family toxin [Vicinamibacterales bacterium]